MTPEIAQFTNRGMNQDISVSKATNEFAFKNHNIRITAVNDNTLLSITNEKLPGDLIVDVTGKKRIPNKITIENPLLNGYRVLLEYSPTTTAIIRIIFEDDTNIVLSITNPNKSVPFTSFSQIKDVEVISRDPNFVYYYGDEVPTETNLKYNNIFGVYLGHAILNEYLVLFTKSSTTDYIYVFTYDDTTNTLVGNIKYEGDLNFSLEHPIETLPYYESEEIQKVYWVDGLNQPRVINIVADDIVERLNTQFDFNPTVTKFPDVTITKEYSGIGLFPAGVIQYFISYYNKFGAETGIVWSSDLQYVTEYNRAAGPDENVVCSFKINIDNVDTTYEYARVYSMQRTSLNTTPICRIVADININNSDTISVVDTNTNTETIDPTQLLFLGGDNFIASTLAQKDDTLFLGDLTIDNLSIPTKVKEAFEDIYDENYTSTIISFNTKTIPLNSDEFQLQQSEEDIKTFKKGEIYRFALQFQTKETNWTVPIWVGDATCNITPSVDDDGIHVANAVVTLSDEIKAILYKYYVNYRLLIAEPTNADRRILAQGIINPTVFNYKHRVKGTGPYAQASWSFRPRNGKAAFEHLEGLGNKVTKENDELVFTNLSTCEVQNSLNKIPGILTNSQNTSGFLASIFVKGYSYSYVIYKVTGASLDDFGEAEEKVAEEYFTTSDLNEATSWLTSSLIEKLHLETEGELGITTNQLYDVLYNIIHTGENVEGNIENTSWKYGWISESSDGIILMPCGVSYTPRYGGLTRYIESNNDIIDYTDEYLNNYYVDSSIVTFHSPEIENNNELFDGSDLNFKITGIVPIESLTSKIDLEVNPAGYSKIAGITDSNMSDSTNAFVNKAIFKDVGWTDEGVLNPGSLVNYYVYLWNKTGSIIGQTPNSEKETDEVNTTESLDSEYAVLRKKLIVNRHFSNKTDYISDVPGRTVVPSVWDSDQVSTKLLHTYEKPVYYQGNYDYLAPTTTYRSLDSSLNYYKSFWKTYQNFDKYSKALDQTAPVRIKYKTQPHLVFEYDATEGLKNLIPSLGKTEVDSYSKLTQEYGDVSTLSFPWLKDSSVDSFAQINLETAYYASPCDSPYFYIGELFRAVLTSEDVYGGVSENAIESINWIPASKVVDLNSTSFKTFGDTYYQRWDCLHSYPFTREDENSIIEVASFMVETHVNIEGRYDKNKVIQELLGINEETYTKVNPVYSQSNNYFTYNILDEKFNQTEYGNQVAFSLQKTPTSEIDTWCNITLASSFNLNGLYGKLTKLINVNDSILAFQDKALSVINFNNRTALSTESGVPIEIANSGKVNGYSVISSNVGCQNKQSICQASSGVYFIDDYNKTMYGFNKEGLSNISSKGMSMWFKKNLTGKEKTFYDSLTNDVYVTNANDCLVFNEGLQAFTSFMDYNNINALFNFNGYSLMLDKSEQDAIIPKKLFSGDYANNYSIEYKINPEPLVDKTFGNIEFIADCIGEPDVIDSDSMQYNHDIKPFDLLEVWNEYQRGTTNLHTTRFKYPNSEKKFRIWRVDIPRDDSNHRDRIRNPWVYLKLSKSEDLNHTKMVFHNLLVKYYK